MTKDELFEKSERIVETIRSRIAAVKAPAGPVRNGWDWSYFDDSNSLLSSEVWEDAETFSVDAFFDLVRRGKNPFRPERGRSE